MTYLADLTELQLEILRVLWESGEATVAEVQDALLPTRDLAGSTVATLLSRLEKKGAIVHRAEGRVYVYRAVASREEVESSMLDGLTRALFGGDVPALVSRLLGSERVDPGDLARVKAMIEARQQELEP